MKIVLLADPLDTQKAGIHVFCKELIAALLKVDKENEYFIVRAEKKNEFPGAKELVFPIREGRPMHLRWRQYTAIPKALNELNPDVVIELAHFGPFKLDDGIKKVTFIHDLTPILFPKFHSKSSNLVHRMLLPGILKRADLVLCNSNCTKKDVNEFEQTTKGKTHVCYLGVNEIFKPTYDKEVLKKYKIESPYFLSVATLEPRKNLETLIEAFNAYKETEAEEKLVLVGKKGWGTSPLIDKINNSPYKKDILITSYVDFKDLPAIYSQAKSFVYPSFYEGFGLPVAEAMACGCRLIVSNSSSLKEVGGEAAHYFDPNSPLELGQKLFEVSKKPMNDEIRTLLVQQGKYFKWENTAIEMLDRVKSLV